MRSLTPRAFDARAVELVETLGTVVAGTIERARLKEEVRDKRRIDSELLVARQVLDVSAGVGDAAMAAEHLQRYIIDTLRELSRFNPRALVERRYDKFRRIGSFNEATTTN